MTLSAREVSRDDLRQICKLSVHPDQSNFVAPNTFTIAQVAHEPASKVFGLWSGDAPVGLMATIFLPAYPFIEENDDAESLFLWRYMIDKEQQGKGFGIAGLKLFVEMARDLGVPRVSSSVVKDDKSAMPFYEGFGFCQTGAILDDELVISLSV